MNTFPPPLLNFQKLSTSASDQYIRLKAKLNADGTENSN